MVEIEADESSLLGHGHPPFCALTPAYLAWGAWNRKPWAWTWLAVVAGFNIVVAIFNLRSEFFQVVLNAVILYYLFRPGVKAAFGRA